MLVFEPGGGLEPVGQELAGVAFLPKVSNEELGNRRIIIDEEELDRLRRLRRCPRNWSETRRRRELETPQARPRC